jgi:Flp pilus assembly pilin Flp
MKGLWNQIKSFWNDEEGLGTLEMLLILAIIVVIAIAFRKWIIKWVNDLFSRADSSIDNTKNLTPNEPATNP